MFRISRIYPNKKNPNLIYNRRTPACAHPCIRYGCLIVVTPCHSDVFCARKTASSVVTKVLCMRDVIAHYFAWIAKLAIYLPPQKVQRPQALQGGSLAGRMRLTAQRTPAKENTNPIYHYWIPYTDRILVRLLPSLPILAWYRQLTWMFNAYNNNSNTSRFPRANPVKKRTE